MDEMIFERLKKVIKEQIDVRPEEIVENATFQEDLGADSLEIVELVMGMEEEFGIEIPDDDVEKLKTVGQAVEYVQEKMPKAEV